ncbi:solute carrier family 41 member 1-like isoform X2 [Anopheles albimanus]|uniref:solute carrier family 41 member 1-like isoform X2 n=1 Tax=Anopheles albimanus TaxID=7167 RepID=UPI00163FC3C6|nr:solute carrier family 41 member 1-like isoform X2 [Anopheles albimanus]
MPVPTSVNQNVNESTHGRACLVPETTQKRPEEGFFCSPWLAHVRARSVSLSLSLSRARARSVTRGKTDTRLFVPHIPTRVQPDSLHQVRPEEAAGVLAFRGSESTKPDTLTTGRVERSSAIGAALYIACGVRPSCSVSLPRQAPSTTTTTSPEAAAAAAASAPAPPTPAARQSGLAARIRQDLGGSIRRATGAGGRWCHRQSPAVNPASSCRTAIVALHLHHYTLLLPSRTAVSATADHPLLGDGAGGKVGNHQPLSSSGSLASIITTSIASSEPDHRGGTISSSIGTGSLAGLDEGEPVVVGAKGLPRATRGPGGDGDGGGGGGAAGDGPGSGIGGSTDGGGGDVVSSGRSGATGLRPEKWWQTTIQIAIPFFIAGIGTIGAGIILGRVEGRSSFGDDSTFISFLASHWKVFKHVTELFILVPALLGLKGNLDMCLASRLSTQANLGNMTSKREILHMIVGNIALVQVQAIVAAFIVSIFAISVGAIMNGNFVFDHAMLLTAASMFTATTSCFVLDFVLVAVILLSNRYQMNPDNLATPLAASIGDVVSISLLSFIATQLFENIDTHLWITFAVVIAYFMLLPMWVFIVLRNTYTRTVLTSGWVPVLSALFISGMGGLVLDTAVGIFNGFVVFQPIINGIGGNLVSVQASKISTMLHQSSILGIIPPHINIFELPWKALFKGVPYAKTARILILMSIPGQVLFIFAADYIHMQRSTIGAPFVLSYLLVSTIQIMLLLYIAHVIIHLMWKWKIDPDNSAIPYLTALGDLLGSSFLMLAFLFLRSIGHPYGEEPDEQELVFGLLPSTGATTLLTTASPDNGSFGGGGDAFTTDLITGAAGI